MTTTDTHYTLIATPGMELFAGCPLCDSTAHALAACPRWNAETGEPLIAKLRTELATAQAKVRERDYWLHEASKTIDKYAAKYGPISKLED